MFTPHPNNCALSLLVIAAASLSTDAPLKLRKTRVFMTKACGNISICVRI
jgi:hypothetical protein